MDSLIPKWLYSYSHYHYLREAIPKRAFYAYEPSGPNLVHKVRRHNRLYAEYRLTPPGETPGNHVSDTKAQEQLGALKTVRSHLTDLDVDVLDILMSIWLDRRGEIEQYIEIDTDHILHARGLKHKVNGQRSNKWAIGRGYTPQQREAINRSICRLLLLWATVKVIHPHKDDNFEEKSRIIELSKENDTWSTISSSLFESKQDKNNNTKLSKRHSISFRPGSIFRHFTLQQKMYHPLKIYNYNYRRRWREKRMARYLLWQWRVNKYHEESHLLKSTSSLVDTMVLNFNQDRYSKHEREEVFDIKTKFRPEGSTPTYQTRKRLERTLDRLRADEIIGGWQYEDGWKPSWSRKSNWVDLWLHSNILIEPSEEVTEAYQTGIDDAPESSGSNSDQSSISTTLTDVKNSNDLTQSELAEMLDISQPYVSALLNGRKTPAPSTARQIRDKLKSI